MGCRNNVLNTVISPIAEGLLRFLGGKYDNVLNTVISLGGQLKVLGLT